MYGKLQQYKISNFQTCMSSSVGGVSDTTARRFPRRQRHLSRAQRVTALVEAALHAGSGRSIALFLAFGDREFTARWVVLHSRARRSPGTVASVTLAVHQEVRVDLLTLMEQIK